MQKHTDLKGRCDISCSSGIRKRRYEVTPRLLDRKAHCCLETRKREVAVLIFDKRGAGKEVTMRAWGGG
jgi:hypothetical protein